VFPSESLRDKVKDKLEMKGIESRPVWKPMHLQPLYKDSPYYGSEVGENLFKKGLCLPSSSILTNDDVAYIGEIIRNNYEL